MKKNASKASKETIRQAWLTERRLRFYPLLLGVVALVAAFAVIVNGESDYLTRVDEMNLFLYTPLFFQQQLVVPGGLLTYLGTYFTQFFYHPWLGTLWLCMWCGVLMWLTVRAFSLSHWWGALVLVPLALVLLTDFSIGYWIYMLKLRGHFFITVIGCSLALASVWAFRKMPVHHGLRWAFMVLAAVVLYPVAGCYGLVAIGLMALVGWRTSDTSLTGKVAGTALAALLVGFVPVLYYRLVYYQTSSDNLWQTALPIFDTGTPHPQYYWPYWLLFGFFALLAVGYRMQWADRWVRKPALWLALQVVIIGGTVWGCQHYWYKDANFHSELVMQNALEQHDWQGMLNEVAASHEEPTRLMWMLKNLAIFKLGRGGDEMYHYRNGSKMPASPFTVPMVVLGGKQLYLHYGLPNYCYRWCMEDGVEYGWRVMYLKYMTRSALVNGEPVLARRFIDLLKQTRYHRDWALHYEQLALHPEQLKKDPELGPVFHVLSKESVLASDQSIVETFLLALLSAEVTSDPVLADLVVQAALQQKDIPTFWRAFNQYAHATNGASMPRHYQEAAYLFGMLEKTVDVSQMPFDQQVVETYQQFMHAAQQLAGMSNDQLANAMRLRFGNTYYYDYFLMRGLKTY